MRRADDWGKSSNYACCCGRHGEKACGRTVGRLRIEWELKVS